MLNAVRQFVKEEEGAAAAEYAILLGMIAAALVTVIVAFRTSIQGVFTRTTTTLATVNPSS